MRLIDANKVEIGFDELCQSPYFKSDVNAKHGAETLMELCVRSDSHKPNTIDPETLPIVQELRKELERVTRERDAAIRDLKECAVENYMECNYCKNEIKNTFLKFAEIVMMVPILNIAAKVTAHKLATAPTRPVV